MNNTNVRILLPWLAVLVLLIALVASMENSGRQPATAEISFSQLLKDVDAGHVRDVLIQGPQIRGSFDDGRTFQTYAPDDPSLIQRLYAKRVAIAAKPQSDGAPWFVSLMLSWLPLLVIIGAWMLVAHRMQGIGGNALGFGKSRAKLLTETHGRVTFEDVAGVDEARADLEEIVEFLRDPRKFQQLGGRIPRGVLLVGSPGVGKTLIARAVAGEAGVPFFTISGSDFVEMFVGVGASRVRDMFEQAKKHAPCIVFIDEIDAVGRHRGAGLGGGHDEREQTLNQLLVEMDGFEGNEGVIVMAATNRPDVLDPALLRPGRFDRQVVVPLPDIRGREQILKVHMRKVPIADDVKALLIARGTPGFSGADLANLVNEAALFAARANKRLVGMQEFEQAKDKIMMGVERKSMVMSEEEKRMTAYHEAGHTIVGRLMPEHDPVYKVTIIPRGRALGVTVFLPEEDRYSTSKRRLESRIAGLYGGRIAEELIFGPEAITTGAANDLEKVTEIARNMVTKWGMSEKLGPLTYGEDEEEVFLGHSVTQHKVLSDSTARIIDEEVRQIVERNYQRARQLLQENMDKLHKMAEALIKYETLDPEQIEDIMAGRDPRPPRDWGAEDRPVTQPVSVAPAKGRAPTPADKPIGGPASSPQS